MATVRTPTTYPPETFYSNPERRRAIRERIEKYERDLATLAKITAEVDRLLEQKKALEARAAEGTAVDRLGAVAPIVTKLLGEPPLLSQAAFEQRGGVLVLSGRLAPTRSLAELVGGLAPFGTLKAISGTDDLRIELEPTPPK